MLVLYLSSQNHLRADCLNRQMMEVRLFLIYESTPRDRLLNLLDDDDDDDDYDETVLELVKSF